MPGIEKISGELLSEPVHIAKINQGSGIGELGLHEELLNLDGLIVGGLTDDSLDFLEVLESSTSLDVLEVNLRVFSLRKNISQVEQGSLIGSKALENLDGLFGLDFVRVLDSNLGNDGDVLSVRLQHVVHALKGVLLRKLTKELKNLVLRNSMSVQHNSLDISHVGVVLKSAAIKSNLLTKLCDGLSIVLGEDVQLEDSLSNVGS